MKQIFILKFTLLSIISGCNGLKPDSIPGCYVRQSRHEFGIEYDTLTVSSVYRWPENYEIERRWKYIRILDGRTLEPEYKVEVSYGLYNDRYRLLTDAKSGLNYSVDVDGKNLFCGSNTYKKI